MVSGNKALTKNVAFSTTSGSAKVPKKSDARRNDYFSAENSHYEYAVQTAQYGVCLILHTNTNGEKSDEFDSQNVIVFGGKVWRQSHAGRSTSSTTFILLGH